MSKILTTYTGEALNEEQNFKDSSGNPRTQKMYLPANDLVDAVNLAIQLKRPLLLMGEPGCGKTRLAEAVAYELHGEKMHDHFFRWDIKSTTKAQGGIYSYDSLERLYHANSKLAKDRKKVEDHTNYIRYGKLANAFTNPANTNKDGYDIPNVLLIDEVDKADIDFPNDLLLELDKKVFNVVELGKKGELKATNNVIIFITSNQEKELPPAFLRRCLFHYINFPDIKDLTKIVEKNVDNFKENTALVKKAIKFFHDEIRTNLSDSDKKPSTGELINWIKTIAYYATLKRKTIKKDRTALENRLIEQLDLLDNEQIPYKQILLKTLEARQKYKADEA